MLNKTPVALIDEYARFFLKSKVDYQLREVTDHKNPFICTVILNGVNYASENGTSKKLAQTESMRVYTQNSLSATLRKVSSIPKQENYRIRRESQRAL